MQSTPYPIRSAVRIDWEHATYGGGIPVHRPPGAGDVGIIVDPRDDEGDYRVTVPDETWENVKGLWVHEDALTPDTLAASAAPRVRVVVASDAADCNGWTVASVIKAQTDPPPPADGPWRGIIVDGPTENGDYFVELDGGALAWVSPSGLTLEPKPPRWVPSVGEIVRITGNEFGLWHGFEPGSLGLANRASQWSDRALVTAPCPDLDGEVGTRWVALANLAPVDVTDREEG